MYVYFNVESKSLHTFHVFKINQQVENTKWMMTILFWSSRLFPSIAKRKLNETLPDGKTNKKNGEISLTNQTVVFWTTREISIVNLFIISI